MIDSIINKVQRKSQDFGLDVRRCLNAKRDLVIYKELYNPTDLKKRPFLNFGAGRFRHPYWMNVDHASGWYSSVQSVGQVEWDILELSKCPLEDGFAYIAYSSHTIEHLTDIAVKHLFKEVYRMLRPNGVFRITAPDALLIYDAYMRKDILFYMREHGEIPLAGKQASLEEIFVHYFAPQRLQYHPEAKENNILYTEDIAKILASNLFEDAMRLITEKCDLEIQSRNPGNHINWWTLEKTKQLMEDAGFSIIQASAFGQSRCAVMRNTAFFDNTRPRVSFYVEAVK